MAPTGLYSRLKVFVTGEHEPVLPAISTATAICLLVIYTLVYVTPFYLSPTTRPSPTLSRDAPSVIRGRIRSVTISCIISSISTLWILMSYDDGFSSKSLSHALHRMGLWPIGLLETIKALALTALLFLGPLFEAGIADGAWRGWIRLHGLDEVVGGWISYRNIVAGPITEEVLFRSCAIPLLLLSETSNVTIIFLAPLVFGLAHVHHFYEFRITHPHTPLIGAVLRSVFQMTYTTLFGGYVTFVYLRTGSLTSVILLHAFCNWRGLPRLWGRLEGPGIVIAPDVGESKKSEDAALPAAGHGLGLMWTASYYLLLVLGAWGWYESLWTWTESPHALAQF